MKGVEVLPSHQVIPMYSVKAVESTASVKEGREVSFLPPQRLNEQQSAKSNLADCGVVGRRKTKLAAKVFLVTAGRACAATVTAHPSVPLVPVSSQSSAFVASIDRESSTDF